jgi:hypothetical protein
LLPLAPSGSLNTGAVIAVRGLFTLDKTPSPSLNPKLCPVHTVVGIGPEVDRGSDVVETADLRLHRARKVFVCEEV